jgi:hypothetical protein
VKQLQVTHAALVHLFNAFQMSLDELCPFDRLNDRGPAVLVRSLQVLECQRSMDVSFFQLRVHGREPAEKVVARVSGLAVWREIEHVAGADRGQP